MKNKNPNRPKERGIFNVLNTSNRSKDNATHPIVASKRVFKTNKIKVKSESAIQIFFIFILIIFLLVEYARLGEFYIPLEDDYKQEAILFISGREVLNIVIGTMISLPLTIFIILINGLWAATIKSKERKNPLVIGMIILFFLMVFFLAFQYIKGIITKLNHIENILLIGSAIFNCLLINKALNKLVRFFYSLHLILYSLCILVPLTLVLQWSIKQFPCYLFAFGVLFLSIWLNIYFDIQSEMIFEKNKLSENKRKKANI